ncbi:MAG TPA: PAS domain S-box protein [Tepidisphaeraceae bacterium]|nr:PAS domain S-box protein [Tepidisphaeraceae bacterium]
MSDGTKSSTSTPAAATEAALRDSASRADAILNTTVDGIITIDERGLIESFNPAAERLFGYTAAEVIGRNVSQLMPQPYQGEHDQYIRNYLTTGRPKIIGLGREVLGLRKDGATFPMHLAVSEVRLPGAPGRPRLFTGIVHDLSERKRLERELLEISDREQRRIGRDLHDGLGQQLAGIGFLSKSLENRLAAQDSPEAADARKIAELVAVAIAQARAMARGLHPVDLKASGLMSALEELAANVEGIFRVRCALDCPQPVLLSDNAVAVHAYRIAQEAVNNALRHGKAKRIVISLERAGSAVTLKVHDDGSGLPATPIKNGGMGMQIMRYRAALISASLSFTPAQPHGTVVSCTFIHPDQFAQR